MPMPWSVTAISTTPSPVLTPMPTREPSGEYWIALETRLCRATDEQRLVAVDLGAAVPALDELDAARLRCHPVLVDGASDDLVDLDELRLGQRIRRLQARELDDLLGDAGEPLATPWSGASRTGAPAPGRRRRCERLGEQADRADRRLELVADVGDEVAAHLVEAVRLGAVVGEQQDVARSRAGRRARRGRCWPRRTARGRVAAPP